ncbi:TM2 domain-containing protein [Soehngenia saccharolytica]|nr:TM2 domain-containing protein [Soehngenia saccharolytica]
MEQKCPKCGAPIQNSKCGYCGYEIVIAKENLDRNGIKEGEHYTINNVQVNNYDLNLSRVNYSTKSKKVALILCLFLGVLGGHNFYVGKIGKGLLYLLTGGLFGIGVIIDLISIIFGSFKDANGLLLK